jgi:predicted nucleic acid-binding protein
VVFRGLETEGDAAGLVDQMGRAEIVGHAPDVIVAEVANALVVSLRASRRSPAEAEQLLEDFMGSPLVLHPIAPMASAAIDLAVRMGLSAYDAFYAVLAATLDAPLVTADRKLADAVPGAVLVS